MAKKAMTKKTAKRAKTAKPAFAERVYVALNYWGEPEILLEGIDSANNKEKIGIYILDSVKTVEIRTELV